MLDPLLFFRPYVYTSRQALLELQNVHVQRLLRLLRPQSGPRAAGRNRVQERALRRSWRGKLSCSYAIVAGGTLPAGILDSHHHRVIKTLPAGIVLRPAVRRSRGGRVSCSALRCSWTHAFTARHGGHKPYWPHNGYVTAPAPAE
jgi:hypothetical protein